MKAHALALLVSSVCILSGFSQNLHVSENGRYIETSEGKPFLWLGDTAWELFHRLNREEATEYLTHRAKQGFTVIQAVVLAENDGLRSPNAYGEVPLINMEPDRPNEKYFEHVDFIVDKANSLGLVVAILPTWGDKLPSLHPAIGPEVFTVKNAETYGAFLGKRYRNKQVVWVLGGDRTIANLEVLEIWRAMARGIETGDRGNHLISFHPRGGTSSSHWLHNEPWLDLNMYQSGHAAPFNAVYEYAEDDYLRQPRKPFLDGEPAYEDIPVKFWDYCDWSTPKRVPDAVLDENGLIRDTSYFQAGFFTDYDVRVHAYWNFLSGACGYTYGNNAVWQMYKKGGPIAIPCLTDWREALDRPGANNISPLRTLLEARSFHRLVPDPSILYGANPKNEHHIRAAQADDRSFVLVYLAQGQPVSINMAKMKHLAKGTWFNPRNGETVSLGVIVNTGINRFTPPTSGSGQDWVLILDDVTANLPLW